MDKVDLTAVAQLPEFKERVRELALQYGFKLKEQPDGEWLPLDFYRGVRKENINAAKRLWRKLKDIGSEITFEEF